VTPAARYAAAIEVIDQVNAVQGPADEVLKAWGRNHRFAGSKDRKALAEIVYSTLRARARASWALGADDGRALVLGALRWGDGLELDEISALFSGEGHAAPSLTDDERMLLGRSAANAPDWVDAGIPEWLARRFQSQFGDVWLEEATAAILPRAPVDLRVNTLRGDVEGALRLLAHEDVKPERTPFSTLGLRLPPAYARDVQKLRAFTSGWVEVQDEGSQIVAALAGAKPGDVVVDYCAGGGGKTLALGAALNGIGRLIASDVNPKRLAAMSERLPRAGLTAESRTLGSNGEGMEDLVGEADLVLVDAPCSGSGTWRRHPESAWRLTPETVQRLSALQSAILRRAARLVKPGGRLVYVTCSMLDAENGEVAARFASDHLDFRPLTIEDAATTSGLTVEGRARLSMLASAGHTLQLTPHRTGTDGFFVALFEKLPQDDPA
jgi:16S rRNA (cytosine967-C5)-methyltransferase